MEASKFSPLQPVFLEKIFDLKSPKKQAKALDRMNIMI
jgi:hypothetical protein